MRNLKQKRKWMPFLLFPLMLLTAACSTGQLNPPTPVAPVVTPTLYAYSPAFLTQLQAELKALEAGMDRPDMTKPAPACARDVLYPGCSATRRFEGDAITVRDQIRAAGKVAS